MTLFQSKIYSSVSENGNITNLFFINIDNLLYMKSNLPNLAKMLKKEVIDRIVSETTLKKVYIERFNDDQNNELFETVMDLNFDKAGEERVNHYFSSRLFVEQEREKLSTFKKIKNIKFVNSETIKCYSFKDRMNNSTLRKNFKYRVELTFNDGIRMFMNNLNIRFKNNQKILNDIKTISENQRLVLKGGSYNLNNFNKKNLPNAIVLDQNLGSIVNFYYDVKNLFNNSYVSSPVDNLASSKLEEAAKISFISGKHEYLIQFCNKFEKLYDFIITRADESEKDIQLLGNNKAKKSVSNTRKTNQKEIDISFTSDEIDHLINFNGSLSYVKERNLDTDTLLSISKKDFLVDIEIDSVDGGIKKKAYSFINRGSKEEISNTSQSIINIYNSLNNLQGTSFSVSPEEQEHIKLLNISEEQYDSYIESLAVLNSSGISIGSNNSNNSVPNTTPSEEYLSYEDSFNNQEDLSIYTDYYTNISEIKIEDLPSSILDISKNIVFNEVFTSPEIRPTYSGLDNLFDPTLLNKIEYLSEIGSGNDVYSFFNPVWKPLTPNILNSDNSGATIICRNINRTNNTLANYLSINEYFLLILG